MTGSIERCWRARTSSPAAGIDSSSWMELFVSTRFPSLTGTSTEGRKARISATIGGIGSSGVDA